ncbi:MAG TPA: ATP F0F1 synthase subunit B [Phenylobacterium sp.]
MLQDLLLDAHFWVGVALVIFLLILVRVGIHKTAWSALGDAGAKVRAQLDEAEGLRREAQSLLDDIKRQRADTETQVAEMLENAKSEATRLQQEAQVKLAEQIKRRGELAERKIATAESQAAAQVKAAAADLAAEMAERVLAQRLAKTSTDPLVDQATRQLAGLKL